MAATHRFVCVVTSALARVSFRPYSSSGDPLPREEPMSEKNGQASVSLPAICAEFSPKLMEKYLLVRTLLASERTGMVRRRYELGEELVDLKAHARSEG